MTKYNNDFEKQVKALDEIEISDCISEYYYKPISGLIKLVEKRKGISLSAIDEDFFLEYINTICDLSDIVLYGD